MLSVFLASQCSNPNSTTPYSYSLKEGWPTPFIPENNPLTMESIELGRKLFYDTRLSIDSSLSCNSCHHAEFGFADRIPLSVGVKGRLGFRNSATLTNVAFLPYLNRDGGVKTLDIFASVPIEDHQEMGFNLLLASERLQSETEYRKAAKGIYDREFDGFVLTRSLASFLRTFISDNSIYDQYLEDSMHVSLSPAQQRGKDLFFGSKANCSTCHSGVLFTDFSFQNNGLHNTYAHKDRGRERITLAPEDEGKFRVAALRNVALTAPYMHDGSLPDLKSVLQHYSSNGANHPNENPLIDKITLSSEEENDIIAFMETLTDSTFINNPDFSDY